LKGVRSGVERRRGVSGSKARGDGRRETRAGRESKVRPRGTAFTTPTGSYGDRCEGERAFVNPLFTSSLHHRSRKPWDSLGRYAYASFASGAAASAIAFAVPGTLTPKTSDGRSGNSLEKSELAAAAAAASDATVASFGASSRPRSADVTPASSMIPPRATRRRGAGRRRREGRARGGGAGAVVHRVASAESVVIVRVVRSFGRSTDLVIYSAPRRWGTPDDDGTTDARRRSRRAAREDPTPRRDGAPIRSSDDRAGDAASREVTRRADRPSVLRGGCGLRRDADLAAGRSGSQGRSYKKCSSSVS